MRLRNLPWYARGLLNFRNPAGLVLERLHLTTSPYDVETKTGIKFRLDPRRQGDQHTCFEVFGKGEYDAGLRRIVAGDTVLDIGANIGCFSLAAWRLGANVIALEPEASSFQRLRAHIELNGADGITPVDMAVTGDNGTCELVVPPNQHLLPSKFATVNGRAIEGAVQSVPCLTLSSLFEKFDLKHVRVLKIDCEGAEHEIIKTMSPQLAENIEMIIVEIHRVPGHDTKASVAHLQSLGYRHSYDKLDVFIR